MSSEHRLAELERKVQYLTDRQEIYDCLVRTSRGNDRFDEALIVGSYHPDGLHELSLADLAEHVRAHLAHYKAPRELVVVDSIGRAPNGKVDYKAVKARALKALGVGA